MEVDSDESCPVCGCAVGEHDDNFTCKQCESECRFKPFWSAKGREGEK